MPAYTSPTPPRTGDVAGTLRLLTYLALAVALLVLDHRGGWLTRIRAQANVAVQPLWWLAGLPARLGDSVRDDAVTRSMLAEDNRRLRNALLVSGARQARLQVAAAENARLRGLLGAAERGGLDVQLAPILDIDLDPTRQRLILDAGSRDGVRQGQSVIDAGGLVGQIIEVTPTTATVLLLTDPDHAVPVLVGRNGVRLVAYGKGRSDELELPNIPLSADVKVGDAIITSGLGGRFPPGFPVGTIDSLRPDDSRAFLLGALKPAARLDRGRDVLLLQQSRDLGLGAGGLGQQQQQQPAVMPGEAAKASPGAPGKAQETSSFSAGPQPPAPSPQPRPRQEAQP
ncbi:rod shape-determining protein MreC [Luteimonas mephitis]|uniref:rod shape-determining protein MreC n=1 Tax=Luteimonas mephitis TaxID=83615 RepID=UPI0004253C23|nr:rod shape-determining protein MreC [Luteimonas mephitis]